MAGLFTLLSCGLTNSSHECILNSSPAALEDLEFWMTHLRSWNGRSLFRDPRPDFTLEFDAAKVGWGIAWRRDPLPPVVSRGLFALTLRQASSNTRELHAAIFGLMAMIQLYDWQDVTVLLRTDNITTLHYLRRMGGRLLHLTRALLPLAECLRTRRIRLLADYLPGIWNLLADPLSRQEASVSDAQLLPAAFQLLEDLWGPHSLDLMVSAVNHQLPRYISYLPDAGALTVNLFTWDPPADVARVFYCFPPVTRVGRVLRWATSFHMRLTLVVPDWPSQPWWPVILHHLRDVRVVLPPQPNLSFGNSAAQVSEMQRSLSRYGGGRTEGGRHMTLDGEHGLSIATSAVSVQRILLG